MAGINRHIELLQPLFEAIVQHCSSQLPREACGLLCGRPPHGDRFVPITNILESETAYEMDPSQLVTSLREMRTAGTELVAIVHSHPRGAAELSKRDLEQAYYPDAAQIVVSFTEPEHPRIRAFRIVGGEAIEIELHVIV